MKSDRPENKTTRQDPSDQRVVLVSASLRQPAAVRPPAAAGNAPAEGRPADGGRGPEPPAGVPPFPRGKESFWAEVASWSVILIALIVGVSVLGWFYWTGDSRSTSTFFSRLLRRDKPAEQAVVAPPPPVSERRRAVDGLPLADGVTEDYVAVMVENMIDSRPLAGLSEAPLVIEAPVEGGITRFLVVYAPGSAVSRIGPVRSARPYYLDWADEFDALYAHVGGSPEALEKISDSDLRDLNQFNRGKYFWRDSGRKAPHNVYTSAELLGQAVAAVFPERQVRPTASWKFKDDTPAEDRPETAADLVIEYSTPAYRVTWKYDRAGNVYRRWQGEDEQRDEGGAPVLAKNVVVQYMQIRILDEVGRRRIETRGEGRALLALDGKTFAAVWKKPSAAERTRYFDESGSEIALNSGTTWIEVVPVGANVKH